MWGIPDFQPIAFLITSMTGLVNRAISTVYSAKAPTTSPVYIFSYLCFREMMISPPTIRQPSWK